MPKTGKTSYEVAAFRRSLGMLKKILKRRRK